MKRLLGLLLLLAILLCSCSSNTPQETEENDAAQDTTVLETETSVAVNTEEALQSLSLAGQTCTGISAMGGDLLLFGKDRLTLLDGQSMEQIAVADIPGLPTPDSGRIQVHADGVAYFDEEEKDMVYLTTNLKESIRLQLPEDLIGAACLCADWSTVYYCTTTQVRAFDMNTGVSRLVKEHVADWQSITGVLLDGTILRCVEKCADGSFRTVLLSSQTGELIDEGDFLATMESDGNYYQVALDRGSVTELVFGNTDTQPQNLWAAQTPLNVGLFPKQRAMVTAHATDFGIQAEYYDLTTGKCVSRVRLEKQTQVLDFAAGVGNVAFLLCEDTLYRWDLSASATMDDTVYTTRHYTREDQNTQELAQMKIRAYQLAYAYGIDIVIGEDAAKITPWDYSFETEYIPQAYSEALPTLEKALSQFPANFFGQAAEKSANKKLTVVLVRGIYGSPEKGTLASAGGCQYWQEGNLYMALQMGKTLERFFYHEMGHVIDTKVLSTSTAFYEWEKLNPADFRYDNNYTAYQNRTDSSYLQDASRCFIDSYAMSFAIEDRSRILEYAALPDNAAYFASETMQKKLQRVCAGIRETFNLEEDERKYIWEQYLKA